MLLKRSGNRPPINIADVNLLLFFHSISFPGYASTNCRQLPSIPREISFDSGIAIMIATTRNPAAKRIGFSISYLFFAQRLRAQQPGLFGLLLRFVIRFLDFGDSFFDNLIMQGAEFYSVSACNFLNFLGHDAGGVRQTLSLLVNAHFPGTLCFAQMPGFVCLQPTVWVSESPDCKGELNVFLFLMFAVPMFQNRLACFL